MDKVDKRQKSVSLCSRGDGVHIFVINVTVLEFLWLHITNEIADAQITPTRSFFD